MRLFQTLLLSAALALPSSFATAQALPGAPPAFVLTQARIAAMLAQCALGGTACQNDVAALVAAARAAGVTQAQLDAMMGQVTTVLVTAAQTGALNGSIAGQGVRGMRNAGNRAFNVLMQQLEIALSTGNFDAIDLTAVAQASGFVPEDDAGDDLPTGGTTGSPA